MFEAVVSRTLSSLNSLNTLTLPFARIRFQICPGIGGGLGVSGVSYTVSVLGFTIKTDTTDADGEATVPALPGVVLRIFDTDYNLSSAPLQAVTSVAGQQQRLGVTGYFTGYQLTALANNPVADGNDTSRFQQAINNFQTDRNLTIDGLIGPQTRGQLQTAAGE
jgi:hypothetical protein